MTISSKFLSLFTLLVFSLSVSALRPQLTSPTVIQQACRATRYPDACQSMVSATSQVKPGAEPSDVVKAAFLASAKNLKVARDMVKDILHSSAQNFNKSRAAKTCLEGLSYSNFRTIAAEQAIADKRLRDARAWGSAALSYQYGCWSGLKYVNDSAAVNSTMSFFGTMLIVSTSNALSMLQALDALGPDPGSWTPPRTERDGFWEPVIGGSGPVVPGFNFAGLTVDATVCKDGSCGCYKTVQEAVDAATENLKGGKRFVIKIREGVYKETVSVGYNKTNLVFIGEGMGKTVITGSLNAGMPGVGTYDSATVGVIGDGFMASGITFENTAGPETHQAVAFRSSSDFSYVENCEFVGNQDTLYVHSLRQLYKSCHIQGNVDFIFGNAAAIFQDCTILVRPRQVDPEKGEKNAIAAHGRTDPAQTTGLVFIGCLINGTRDYMELYRAMPSVHLNYLGRPWKLYSRTVYINCTMESLISEEGWLPWDADFALTTLYYGEVGNKGDGAGVAKRVPWSKRIPEEHVSTYYVLNFLQGDEWITNAS